MRNRCCETLAAFGPLRRWGAQALSFAVVGIVITPVAWGQAGWSGYPNNNAISITSGGNVGIGTATPTNLLHIKASSDTGDQWTGLRFIPASTDGSTISNYNTIVGFRHSGLALAGSNNGSAYTKSYVLLDDAGVRVAMSDGFASPLTKLMVTNAGNVGIGTLTPQYLLSVNGQIGAKDVIVTSTGWSDYVFEPGYRLRPLREVAAYIRAKRHLPDIPSASEVKEKGVSMAEMQAKLLAKVEELTLHMIQSEERNNRLEQQNQQLRRRITRLERNSLAGSKLRKAK